MSRRIEIVLILLAFLVASGMTCVVAAAEDADKAAGKARIVLLHHSTGECIWNGGVPAWFNAYNQEKGTAYSIVEQAFPKAAPYGWENYPFDYWNIWVRHAGVTSYKDEPTLEILTKQYDVIVFKHCFPVSAIEMDIGKPDVASDAKRIENYKLQYAALRKKLRSFPKTKFLVWTGAALLETETDRDAARRASVFFTWVKKEWDEPGDNIFLWDFRQLETGGGLYLDPKHAAGDSHPNDAFSRRVAPLLCGRIVDVIEGRGDALPIVGRELGVPRTHRVDAANAEEAGASAEEESETPATPPIEAGPFKTIVFDDAEAPARLRERWGEAVRYVEVGKGKGHALGLDFQKGALEDWGEYGKQRLIASKRPAKNEDVSAFDRLRFRVKSDRAMEIVVMLVTRPDKLPRDSASHFTFSSYVKTTPGVWQPVDIDLTAMELGMEGEEAYQLAGKPSRIFRLSEIRFVTNQRNEKATVLMDDVVWLRSAKKANKTAER